MLAAHATLAFIHYAINMMLISTLALFLWKFSLRALYLFLLVILNGHANTFLC